MASDDEDGDYPENKERTAKQKYLNDDLIDLGYNPQLFMEYISRVKEANVDLWTIEELQTIVAEFKAVHSVTDQVAPKEITAPVTVKIEEKPNVVVEAKAEVLPSAPEEIKHEIHSLRSKPSDQNQLTSCKELIVTVSEPQVTGGGFLSKKYVVYTITTAPLGWSVKRRYSDFHKLRELLSHLYIISYLPPLPAKKAKGNLEEKTIHKRQQFLHLFVISLTKDPLLRGSPQVLQFLKESDNKAFKKFIESFKLKKPETVIQTINTDGVAFADYGDCDLIYEVQMKYITTNEFLKRKIKQKCSQLMEFDGKLGESLKKYAELIKELEENHKKLGRNEGNSAIFKALNESLVKWAGHEIENVIEVNKDIRIPYSYSCREMGVLKELIRDRESLYSNYKKLELKQKPEKSRDALERAKEMFGYANYKAQKEVERVVKDATELACIHFMKSARDQAERVTKFHMIWGELMQNLSNMKFDLDKSSL